MDDQSVSMGAPEASGPAAPPDAGPLGRIMGVFLKPKQTFESMRERPRFLLALILVAIVQLGIASLIVSSGIARDEAVAKLEAQGADQAKIDTVEKFMDSPVAPVFTVVTAVVAVGFGIVAGAALLFFMGNLMLGGRLQFRHYVCAVAFGWVVMLVDNIVRASLILAKHGYDVRLGLGNLFGEDVGFGVRALDAVTDPLLLWSTAITALAVSVFAKKGFGFGVIAVLPGFLIGAVLQGMGR